MVFFFFNDTATTEIYTLSLHDALPISLITDAVLEEAIDRVIAGPERKTRAMSEKEKKVTAYHEGGHALVAHALPNLDPVHKVTILPRGRSLGHTLVLPTEDKYTQTRSEMIDTLA